MDIVGYENYLIYDDGRVYSKQRQGAKGKFLKSFIDKDGYYRVDLRTNGKKKSFTIHRLVGLHYLENVEDKNEIDHIDRNKTNNHISNLRWCNKSENQLNKGVSKNNVLGIKHIRKTKYDTYTFTIYRQDKWHTKSFKALDECIKYRDEYLKCSNTCAGR